MLPPTAAGARTHFVGRDPTEATTLAAREARDEA
jgi:hypothetical protein